jgi:hypothetical protein
MPKSHSWEANSSSASQKISCILWKPVAPYRIYTSPPPAPMQSQINSVYVPDSNF